MAKANPETPPLVIRKALMPYRIYPEANREKQGSVPPGYSVGITKKNHLVAEDTLSDWRRKSATTRPARYPSEHRRERRRTANLNVRLHRQGKALGTTRICDVNSRGIGVECGKLDLHAGEVVEIDLPENALPDGLDSHACCLVIHTGKQCGLMLLDLEGR
ncbi:MAG TPA: hypothetical protein ENK51_01860 [Gammaproteobacteria bacterium]|nr:hypothetical protein [Gammaproteobacteria bacterium]